MEKILAIYSFKMPIFHFWKLIFYHLITLSLKCLCFVNKNKTKIKKNTNTSGTLQIETRKFWWKWKNQSVKKIDRAPKNTYLTILSGHIDLKQNEWKTTKNLSVFRRIAKINFRNSCVSYSIYIPGELYFSFYKNEFDISKLGILPFLRKLT